MSSFIDLVQHGIAGILLTLGALFYLIGAIGVIRMPDVFTRLHAISVSDTLGLGLIFAGLMVSAGFSLVLVKLLFLLLFIWFASPFATHAMVQTALHGDVTPLRRGKDGGFIAGDGEPDIIEDE